MSDKNKRPVGRPKGEEKQPVVVRFLREKVERFGEAKCRELAIEAVNGYALSESEEMALHQRSLSEIIERFPNGDQRYRTYPLFNACVHQLLTGTNVYAILGQVLNEYEKSQQQLREVLTNKK
jgi:hypothetical protein